MHPDEEFKRGAWQTVPRHDGMEILAVLGHPVGHSLSPVLQQAALDHLGIAAVYTALDITPDDLRQAMEAVRLFRFRGVNLTIPHKEQAVHLVDRMTGAAARIGAVNTLYWDAGQLVGDNTDGAGWLRSVVEEQQTTVSGMRAVVLGAGGAARAIVDALLAGGCAEVVICNRTLVRATDLADYFARFYKEARVVARPLEQLNLVDVDLLVNTTPLGMSGHMAGVLPVAQTELRPGLLVSDIVYRPLQTPLLEAARAQNAATHAGLGMLVYQGALAFERWFGVFPPVALMRDAALQRLQERGDFDRSGQSESVV